MLVNKPLVIAKTVEIDKLRFTDKDLDTLGTLDQGQFGKVGVSRSFCDNKT
jgi:hypothetical protein